MGLFEIFNKGFSSMRREGFEGLPVNEAALSGLNIKQLMEKHSDWKAQLQDLIQGRGDHSFNIDEVSADCHCFLGRWIYGTGKIYSHLPEYESLRKAHANFHKSAGEVLSEHMHGNKAEAQHLLDTKFRSTSNQTKFQLVSLFAAVQS